jgi:hypothetical protein
VSLGVAVWEEDVLVGCWWMSLLANQNVLVKGLPPGPELGIPVSAKLVSSELA